MARRRPAAVELVRSLPVGRSAPTVAAALAVVAMNLVVGGLVALTLIAQHLPVAGSIVFGLSFIMIGLVFACVAVVVAQVTENTRVVYGVAGALLGAAFVLRAVGDIGDGTISWLSPIGWVQKTRPFAGEKWWPFVPTLFAIAVLVAVANGFAARRDLGAGLVQPRPGRRGASPSLGNPFGLAVRLQRGSLVGWGAGVLFTAVAYGSIADSIDDFVRDNKALADMFARAGSASLTDSYLATSMRILALVGTGFVIQSVLRLRSEETSLHAEPVLAAAVSRSRWAMSHMVDACGGAVILLAVAGLGVGVSYGAVRGDLGVVPGLLGAAFVYVPAMWLMAGLTFALVGLAPRRRRRCVGDAGGVLPHRLARGTAGPAGLGHDPVAVRSRATSAGCRLQRRATHRALRARSRARLGRDDRPATARHRLIRSEFDSEPDLQRLIDGELELIDRAGGIA